MILVCTSFKKRMLDSEREKLSDKERPSVWRVAETFGVVVFATTPNNLKSEWTRSRLLRGSPTGTISRLPSLCWPWGAFGRLYLGRSGLPIGGSRHHGCDGRLVVATTTQ